MPQNVMITGTGRKSALGFNLVLRYLEAGDNVVATIRKESGWIRTDGREDNPAPLTSYDAAETLRLLFEKRRYDKRGHRFITYENEDYPF